MRWMIVMLVLISAASAEAGCRGGRCGIVKKSVAAAKKVVTAPVRILR